MTGAGGTGVEPIRCAGHECRRTIGSTEAPPAGPKRDAARARTERAEAAVAALPPTRAVRVTVTDIDHAEESTGWLVPLERDDLDDVREGLVCTLLVPVPR